MLLQWSQAMRLHTQPLPANLLEAIVWYQKRGIVTARRLGMLECASLQPILSRDLAKMACPVSGPLCRLDCHTVLATAGRMGSGQSLGATARSDSSLHLHGSSRWRVDVLWGGQHHKRLRLLAASAHRLSVGCGIPPEPFLPPSILTAFDTCFLRLLCRRGSAVTRSARSSGRCAA